MGGRREVASLNGYLDVAVEMLIEQLGPLLLPFVQTVLPVSSFPEDLACGLVVAELECAPRVSSRFVCLSVSPFDVISKFGVEVWVLDKFETLPGSIVVAAFAVGCDGVFEKIDLLVKFSGRLKQFDLAEPGANLLHDSAKLILLVVDCELHSSPPYLLEQLHVFEIVRSDIEIGLDSFGVVSGVVPALGLLQLLLWRLVRLGRLPAHDLLDQMRSVLACDPQCFLGVVGLQVHLYGEFWLAGVDVGGFGLGVLPLAALDEALRLVYQYPVPGLRLVLARHRQRRVEVPDILVHADGFLRLAGLDELHLGLLIALLVFKFESELEVDIPDLVLGVEVGHLEGFVELPFVGKVLNHRID